MTFFEKSSCPMHCARLGILGILASWCSEACAMGLSSAAPRGLPRLMRGSGEARCAERFLFIGEGLTCLLADPGSPLGARVKVLREEMFEIRRLTTEEPLGVESSKIFLVKCLSGFFDIRGLRDAERYKSADCGVGLPFDAFEDDSNGVDNLDAYVGLGFGVSEYTGPCCLLGMGGRRGAVICCVGFGVRQRYRSPESTFSMSSSSHNTPAIASKSRRMSFSTYLSRSETCFSVQVGFGEDCSNSASS
mmetsp:Transcript_12067/g.21533  ORF Transcript_12067/g.21533 Transcript_12067/m.21533 type:complete len:248 (-) Transcript_12067:575-1318(-)